jgi:hypothetical protein
MKLKLVNRSGVNLTAEQENFLYDFAISTKTEKLANWNGTKTLADTSFELKITREEVYVQKVRPGTAFEIMEAAEENLVNEQIRRAQLESKLSENQAQLANLLKEAESTLFQSQQKLQRAQREFEKEKEELRLLNLQKDAENQQKRAAELKARIDAKDKEIAEAKKEAAKRESDALNIKQQIEKIALNRPSENTHIPGSSFGPVTNLGKVNLTGQKIVFDPQNETRPSLLTKDEKPQPPERSKKNTVLKEKSQKPSAKK